MLCELPQAEKLRPQAGLLPIILLNCVLTAWTPLANAQVSNSEGSPGEISGTVLLEANNRPASQVLVSLKSSSAPAFRSVLTDLDGQFDVRGLIPGTYEISIEEPGYEPTRISAQLYGAVSKVVLRLRPSKFRQAPRNDLAVSVRELK